MDIIVYNILAAFICILFGYLCGSFPSGVLIGKALQKKDPRNYGSKNSGGTNVSRLWGFKVGVIVYILDFFKLIVPLWTSWAILTYVKFGDLPLVPTTDLLTSSIPGMTSAYIIQWPVYWLTVIGCALGHCWPCFSKFKGGKAASVTYSAFYFSGWMTLLSAAGTFASTLAIKKYVSLGSIVGAIVASSVAWLTCIPEVGAIAMYGNTLCPGWIYALTLTLTSLIMIARHYQNIGRLIHHEERRITWLDKKQVEN